MSFDDNENKVNNNSARSFFSQEELEESAKDYNSRRNSGNGAKTSSGQSAAQRKSSGARQMSQGARDNDRVKASSAKNSGQRRMLANSENMGRSSESRHLEQISRRTEHDQEPQVRGYDVSDRVAYISQQEIPRTGNELTRHAALNNTSKVKKRAARVERFEPEETVEENIGGTVSVMSDDPTPVENYKLNAKEPAKSVKDAFASATGVFKHDKSKDRNIEMYDSNGNLKKSSKNGKKPYKKKGPTGKIVKLVILAVVIVLCIVAYTTARKVCYDQPMNSSDTSKVQITITEDSTDSSVAEYLVKNKLVESKFIYKLRAILYEASYKEGTYELSPSYTTEKIIDIISGYTTTN